MTQANKQTLDLVNDIVDKSPGVKGKLAEQGIDRIKDNQDMRELSRTLASIDAPSYNEYYTNLINKVGTQIMTKAYDSSGFKNTLDIFNIVSPPTGSILEVIDNELIATGGIGYGNADTNEKVKGSGEEANNPFIASKVKNYQVQLVIKETIHASIENQTDVISEAFMSTQNLDAFIMKMIETLKDSVDSKVWNEVRQDLLEGFKTEIITDKIYDLDSDDGAKQIYKFITKIALDMSQEQTKFNEGSSLVPKGPAVPKLNATPLNKQILLLNSNLISSFNISVIATLFNSNKLIGEGFKVVALPFTKADRTDIVDADRTLGFLMDAGRYVISTKINNIGSIYNPKGGSIITHYNKKMFFGHISYFNGVKILNKT